MGKGKILVVDNVVDALDFEQFLESFGYDVVSIDSKGKSIVEKFAEFDFELVLINEINGMETAAQIKEKFNIPLIYTSANPEKSNIKQENLKSLYDYIVNPVFKSELKNIIELALCKHRMKNKLNESEVKYIELLDNALDMITLTEEPEESMPGKFIEVNKVATERLGYSRQEFLNMNPTDIIAPEIRSIIPEIIGKISKYGYNKFEIIHMSKDGKRIPVEVYNHQFELNGKNVVLAISRDITERKKAEYSLIATKRHLENVFRNAPIGIFQTTWDGKFIIANQTLADIFGYESPEELISIVNKTDIKHKLYVDKENRHRFINEVIKDCEWHTYENRFYCKDGSIILSELFFRSVHNPDGTLKFLEGFITDITSRKLMENALRDSEEKYRTLFEADPDYTILLDLEGVIIDINPAAERVIGLPRNLLLGKHFLEFDVLLKENLDQYIEMFEIVQKNGDVGSFETKIFDKNSEVRWVRIISTIIDKGKNCGYILVIGSDITERKLAEEELKSSLKEKDLLLKEIHHRVKNNLQIISSLLDLQKPFVEEDPIALNVLKGSQNRVVSMAMVHEMLYQSQDLNHINISNYIKNLISNLFHSNAMENNIKPILNVEDFYLNIETSIPLGLIISELVSNSLKYAFPEGNAGEINISLQCINPHFELIISDNGIGLPEDIDIKNIESSLGLRLVNSLVNQLDGTIELDRRHGTEYNINFKELKYEKRV